MKTARALAIACVLFLSASLLTGCMMMTPVRTVNTVVYENPQWAPPYYSGARYYYLPDLELYYDLSNREYIYLLNGRWRFSPYLPALYQNYDLADCFCVVLNVQVYKPWLHHQYYLSHYPRYYYRDYYDHSGIPYVRAYNENLRRAIYWSSAERHRARPWDNENSRDNRRFKYSREDRQEQQNQARQGSSAFGGGSRGEQQRTETQAKPRPANTNTRNQETAQPAKENNARNAETTTSTRSSGNRETAPVRNDRTNYYGKTIGTSVRVTKQMRDNTPAAPAKSPSQRR